MKLSELKSAKEILKEDLRDPEFREHWNRTALARAVAISLVRYRDEKGLTQTELARLLGMKQPAIARLEVGDMNPRWETLMRIADSLRLEFLVAIAPRRQKAFVDKDVKSSADIYESSDDGKILVAVR